MKTIEQILEAGKVLAVLTLTDGEVVPFYEGEVSDDIYHVLVEQIKEDISKGLEKSTTLVDENEVAISLDLILNVRNFLTGESVYFNDVLEQDDAPTVFSEEAFKKMELSELYEALVDLHDIVANHIDDEIEANKDAIELHNLQFDAIYELGKRLGKRK